MELNCSGFLSFAEGLSWQFPEEMEILPFDFKRVKHSKMFQGWDMDWRKWKREMKTKKIQGVRSGGKPKVSITFQPRLEDNSSGKNLGKDI